MGFRKYIVRNRDYDAWLVEILAGREGRTYRFLPDPGRAMIFDTVHEARRTAEKCRGRAQILKAKRKGELYAEDIPQDAGTERKRRKSHGSERERETEQP